VDLLRNPRKRRIAVAVVALAAAALAGVALLLNRLDSAEALTISAAIFIGVEVVYTMNQAAGRTIGGPANSNSMRFTYLAGALFFWALAVLLLVLGIIHLFQP
jgi:hypothetical protein